MPFSLGQILGGWRRKEGKTQKSARKSFGFNHVKSRDILPPEGFSDPKQDKSFTSIQKGKSDLAWRTIVSPHISEKGGGRYIFKVASRANKPSIKRAIEERYGVAVHAVNVINMPAKPRKHGQMIGEKSGFKKAIIILKEGQSINEY